MTADGNYPLSYTLMPESVSNPVGADTLFLLATREKIHNLSLLTCDGVIEAGTRGAGSGIDALMINLNDAASRGASPQVTTWQVQQAVIPSRP